MNNEISSKLLSPLSSVDATLAAIIPDTPIVSIAGSTLSEITTTTTSTTTTPTPTPTSYETNKADISSSMSGVSPKIAGTAINRATAASSLSSDDSVTKNPTDLSTLSASDNNSSNSTNLDECNLNHATNTANSQTTTNTADSTTAAVNNSGAKTKSPPIIVSSSTGNTKSEVNATDKKSKDSELLEEDKFTNLDEGDLRLLLEEAISYRSPTDKENKSKLFLSLLKKAENETEDITLRHMPTSSNLKRNLYPTYSSHYHQQQQQQHHQQHHHHNHRHKHSGSLQDLNEAGRNDPILDSENSFGNSYSHRNRRNNHNSRQKKYSTSVSSRQREGGSLPNNVNFINCTRLFGVGGGGGNGGGGCINASGDVAGITSIEHPFPFMHEINTVASGAISSTAIVVAPTSGTAGSSNINSGSNTNSNNNCGTSSSSGNNNNKQQRRNNVARTNVMSSSTSLTTTPNTTNAATKTEDELNGQPISVVIGGQVIKPKSPSSVGNSVGCPIDITNNRILGTGCHAIGDCVIEMGETIIDVQQKQQISQSKSQDAISQGRVFYDRLDNIENMARSNMKSTVPSRTCFGPTTANTCVDEKVSFTVLSATATFNPGGSRANQPRGVDTKYLSLDLDYKSCKSILAKSDKEDMRDVDENGNAVIETSPLNATHATTGRVFSPINGTSAAVVTSATANPGSSTQTTKSKSKKAPKTVRNETMLNVREYKGYRGEDTVEELLEYIESSTVDDNKNKPKKERKKQEKQDKHNKVKKSNSLEELRSCAKIEVDVLKRTAATTESNVMMRHKAKGVKNNSSSSADINKNFESATTSNNNNNGGANNTSSTIKEKSKSMTSAALGSANRKGERRSWGTEELQYLGDTNGNKIGNAGSQNRSNTNAVGSIANQTTTDDKVKDKDRKNKNRDSQKDRVEEKDKIKTDKIEKVSSEAVTAAASSQVTVLVTGNPKQSSDKGEKPHQQVDKLEKRKKGETQQGTIQQQSLNIPSEPAAVVDILAMESLLPETAEFHVVTKKKKTKKQRSSLDDSNGMGNNNSKTHNFIATTTNLKVTSHQQQTTRFNAKFNSNEHANNSSNGNNNNSNNHYQQHNNNHCTNHQQLQQQQQHQQQHQQLSSDKSRRKSTSSVPPSEKSDSSDLDSVHSLPVEKAAKVVGATNNSNATKTSNKQMRQSKNTAGSAATTGLPQKPQQMQQMPTQFSYAEIIKEGKSLTSVITTNSANNNVSNNDAEHVSNTQHNNMSQQHPPITTEEVKTVTLRGQQLQQAAISNVSASATSTITTSSAAPASNTNTSSNTLSSNSTYNSNTNKTNKTKKSGPKSDFPALGLASDVAVAASAARADIFAKAVQNSSQNVTTVQNQTHNPNTRDVEDNVASGATTKLFATSHIEIMPKEANHQVQQQQQQQQTLQKSKSVEHEVSSSIGTGTNISYSNTMDHHQYPALKTVKRHSASSFTTLPPSTSTNTITSTSGVNTQLNQQLVGNPSSAQFNFAAAARQMAPNASVSTSSNSETAPLTVSEITTSNSTTGTTATTAIPKKHTGSTKDKTLPLSSITNATPATAEHNPKKNKKEKQQSGELTSKSLSTGAATAASLSHKSTAATQTSRVHPIQNENNGKQSIGPKQIRAAATSSSAATINVASMLHPILNPIVPLSNRPAVIILNDSAAEISTDFTFGDFNEDELYFFDDESEEYAAPAMAADEINDNQTMPTSSSPRSGSVSIPKTTLPQLNDSGSCSDLCIANNASGSQQPLSPQGEDILNSSDSTLSPNNSMLTAIENQNSSDIAVCGGTSCSSRSNVSGGGQSYNSSDSGIYTIVPKLPETVIKMVEEDVDATNANTFIQQHATNQAPLEKVDSSNIEAPECIIANTLQPRQQQLETCKEIESVIIAAARRAANQQQQCQQHKSTTANVNYQHSNSNSSSFSSSSSVDGGVNRYYTTAQSPPPPSHVQHQQQHQHQQQQASQQEQQNYYNSNRQAFASYPVYHPQQQQQQQHAQQLYHQNQNYNIHPQTMISNANATPANAYSRSNSDCDEDFVSPPPDTFVVKIQNKEYDLHYLPPNLSTTSGSQNEFIVEYVSSVWDEVMNSKHTRIYDGQ